MVTRIRPALTASSAAALAVLLATAGAPAALATTGTGAAPSAVPTCRESSVSVAASLSGREDLLRIRVTNRSVRPCAVDRVPTITFGDLDGAARPVPPVPSAPYRLAAGATAYAAVRTVHPEADETRDVADLAVAADPSHRGTRFTGAALGQPDGMRVWDPVTTQWHSSRAGADAALAAAGY
ncbi:hypothetical protein GCM10009654_54920 [Streptomyces hebeiensis]|uniref:DUF4232 domain-containing protein n=1 Tax=Streptomyces hebeiensis TaxID=229486 RepID=A0ABN1V2A1_9ACTN